MTWCWYTCYLISLKQEKVKRKKMSGFYVRFCRALQHVVGKRKSVTIVSGEKKASY
jgi:hypothetical protein